LQIRFRVWLLSGYAHVFVIVSVVIEWERLVMLPSCLGDHRG